LQLADTSNVAKSMDIKSGTATGGLSNFAARPFIFRGVQCNSMEGLLQSLKFKEPDMQKHVCTLVGIKAKRTGANKPWHRLQILWWQGIPIKRESQEYQDLLDEAYNALFTQNTKARAALLATGDAVLKHSIGKRKTNETVLTQQEFCSRLMSIRTKLKTEEFISL